MAYTRMILPCTDSLSANRITVASKLPMGWMHHSVITAEADPYVICMSTYVCMYAHVYIMIN